MALFFHAFEVDHLISLKEGVRIVEDARRDFGAGKGTSAPQRRLYIHHEDTGGKPYATVANVYAGGSLGYGAIGAHVALRVGGGALSTQRMQGFS